jgi:hypothetical protein
MTVDRVPIVEDVAFRMSEAGDFFGIDFHGRDGQMRSAAFSTVVLEKLIAGCLWTAAEAGLRGVPSALTEEMRHVLQEGAPVVTDVRLVPQHPNGGAVLELSVGAGAAVLRMPPEALRSLFDQLAEQISKNGGAHR